jgi:hypothetical protein
MGKEFDLFESNDGYGPNAGLGKLRETDVTQRYTDRIVA